MPLIPKQYEGDPTILAAESAMVDRASREQARAYLGLSGLGDPCQRKVWQRFRWAIVEQWDAETLKRFEDGHATEALWLERLRLTPGLEVWTTNPDTGHQWSVTCAKGHAKGHADAIVRGLFQAPKTTHVGEVKASEKGPGALAKTIEAVGEKQALAKWHLGYWVQAQAYMAGFKLTRHYLICSPPGGRGRATTVRTDFDAKSWLKWSDLAEQLVFAQEPPERIGSATWWQCRSCGFHGLCHGGLLPSRNCRTCLSSTPIDGGIWRCERYGVDLTEEQQRLGCDSHRYIPALINGRQVDVRGESIVYQTADGSEWVDDGLST